MSIQVSSTQDFDTKIAQSDKLVLVDFWAPWCGPCRMVAPVLDEISKEYNDQVVVLKVNVDDHQDLASRFGIMSIPTLILFKKGQAIDQIMGAPSKNKLSAWINSALAK